MKKLLTLIFCCFVATFAFAQKGKQLIKAGETIRDLTPFVTWSGKTLCEDCPRVWTRKLPERELAKLNEFFDEVKFAQDIQQQVRAMEAVTPLHARQEIFKELVEIDHPSATELHPELLTPEKYLPEQDRNDVYHRPNLYVQGGDGNPAWLSDDHEIDILLAGDVFAENAPHEFFAQPIRHSDGNIYVQVLRPFLAFDRYGTRQLVRFESGRYINIENPFNIEGEQTFGLRLGPVERLTGMSKSPKFQTQDYPRVRQLAADSALRMNVPITVTQLYALLRVRGEYDSSFFGPTLLAKKLLLRWQDPALFSLTPLKQSFLLGQGTDFQPLPRNSYLGFNPGKITEQTAFSGIDPIAKGSKVLADMAYSLDEIMRKDYTQNLRAKFFEVQYDPKNNDFFAHLKKGHFLLLKDKDGSLKVLTDQDIIKIIPKYPAEFAAQLLHYRGERVNMQLLDGKTFPLVDAYGGIAHASLRTIPTPLEQWEKEAFQGGDYLNQPFTSQDYARFMPITHQGGLSQLPSGTPSPKQPYVRTTPTMAERAELNRQKAAKTYPAERILPQAKSQASAAELNPDFKPLPSHDPSLFEPDPEATPFGQDPEELPDYVLQAMWDTNLIANYQKSLFVVNIPLNYVGPVKKFKSNEDGTIWYFAEVYHSFPAWDSGKVIQAGHYLDLQELTRRLRAWSYSPEEIERNFVEVTE